MPCLEFSYTTALTNTNVRTLSPPSTKSSSHLFTNSHSQYCLPIQCRKQAQSMRRWLNWRRTCLTGPKQTGIKWYQNHNHSSSIVSSLVLYLAFASCLILLYTSCTHCCWSLVLNISPSTIVLYINWHQGLTTDMQMLHTKLTYSVFYCNNQVHFVVQVYLIWPILNCLTQVTYLHHAFTSAFPCVRVASW